MTTTAEGINESRLALYHSIDLGDVAKVSGLVQEHKEVFDQDANAMAMLLTQAHRHPILLATLVSMFSQSPAFPQATQLWMNSIRPKVEVDCDTSVTAVMRRMEKALGAFARGEFVIVVDAHDRENEGDLIIAGEFCTPAQLAFMVNHTSGLICAPMVAERADDLQLPLMVPSKANQESHGTAFTVSVDLDPKKHHTTTGISAQDRARTLTALSDMNNFGAEDFARPGHIFPLRYREGGVFVRPGHTEASVDLCKLTNLSPVAAICEITKPDGAMARLTELTIMANQFGLELISIEDMIIYRKITEGVGI